MDKELRRKKHRDKQRKILQSKEAVEHQVYTNFHFITPFLFKFLTTVVCTLIALILLKSNPKWRTVFYKHVYDTNFSFATVNHLYESYFGSPIPFKNLVKTPVETVFNEKLTYQNISSYQDGAKLTVTKNYLIPIIKSGMVVFIGEKEGYGNTVIIQGVDGVDIWYGNVGEVNVKLYDYVSQGTLLGEAKSTSLYLVFQKEGKKLDYKEYLS